MHIYGYDLDQPFETARPVPLAEITLNASPAELRTIARFLHECADEMDRMGEKFDHLHLADRVKEFETSPHFVVSRR